MRNKICKKMQKDVNKVVREMNQSIYNDELWLGRFYGHQIRYSFGEWDDHSGGWFKAWIELVDRKTGTTKLYFLDHSYIYKFMFWDLYWAMNNFIVNDCKVWEDEDPTNNVIDYRKEKR